MKLDICVPHYKEPWPLVKPFFESLKAQRAIDFRDIRVIMVNDGKQPDSHLSVDELEETQLQYPFRVDVFFKPHEGVSAARNYAFDEGDADYVMFCDCDDSFANIYGLRFLFDQMEKGYDAITSIFLVEYVDDDDQLRITYKDNDVTFVHGKAYRRQYLNEKNIRWKPELTIHEDGYFNCLALMLTDNKTKIDTPFYTWKYREGSVASKNDDLFVLKTYKNVMDARMALTKEAKRRGRHEDARGFIAKTVLDSYYDFNKTIALDPKNKDIVDKAELEFKRFYMRYRKEYLACTIDQIAQVAAVARANAYTSGLKIEQRTLREWLNHIVYEVKE